MHRELLNAFQDFEDADNLGKSRHRKPVRRYARKIARHSGSYWLTAKHMHHVPRLHPGLAAAFEAAEDNDDENLGKNRLKKFAKRVVKVQAKAVKKIVKRNVKVLKSKAGKAIIGAAALYFTGGAALPYLQKAMALRAALQKAKAKMAAAGYDVSSPAPEAAEVRQLQAELNNVVKSAPPQAQADIATAANTGTLPQAYYAAQSQGGGGEGSGGGGSFLAPSDSVTDSGAPTGSGIMDKIKENPIPTGLAVAGILYFLTRKK